MKRWRNKQALIAGAALLALALPALAQEVPQSILPPNFDDPPPATPAPPAPPPRAVPQPAEPAPSDTVAVSGGAADIAALEELIEPREPIEIPDDSRRPTDIVGTHGPENWGVGEDAYGRTNGRFLSTLMRRVDGPLPSRWTSILLRRTLLSRTPAPRGVNPVDWIAERAWLLLRLGEADGARALVQYVDVDRFTPKMFEVAVQTALATSDPAALCPLVKPGRESSDEAVWPLADAMCAALEGEASRASALIDQARRRTGARGIDLLLAEKVIGAGTNTRRAVSIQWDDVDRINSWRFGLATATGLEIPARLMSGAGGHVRAWLARAPMIPLEQRLAAADDAAALGVFSNASLVEIYSLIADRTDPEDFNDSVGGRLRRAYRADSLGERLRAMRSLWARDEGRNRYAGLILTSAAVSRLKPDAAVGEDLDDIIASALAAGFDTRAAAWAPIVSGAEGEAAARAWALLAVGAPSQRVETSAARIRAFRDADASEGDHATKLLLAALAGLGRLNADDAADLAGEMGVRLGGANRWTRAIDAAAEDRQPGTVALLAGVGMQTSDWRGVPAEHLFHIVRALRIVGREYEARMIAAEAITRL